MDAASNVGFFDQNIWSTSSESAILEGTQVLTTVLYDLEDPSDFSSSGKEIDNISLAPGWSFRPIRWSWWVILQVISAILGIIGNGLVMLVLFQRRANSRSTDTLVGALAAADFLTSIFIIPLPRVARIPPPTWVGTLYCNIHEAKLFKDTFHIASIYILVAISTERYIAVVHPIYFQRILTRRRVSTAVLIILAFAILMALPKIASFHFDDVRGKCFYQNANRESQVSIAIFLFSLQLLIPTLIMLITQLLIAKHLYRQARRFKGRKTTSFHDVARLRVLKLMLIVIISYVVCWGPNNVAFILQLFDVLPRSFRGSAVFNVFIALSFFNSCLNPIIYAVRFKEFRSAVWEMFRGQKTSRSAIFEQDAMADRHGGSKGVPPTCRTDDK